MYILFDEEGSNFTNDNLQAVIKEAKASGYGSFDCWDIYQATKIEVIESYSVKTDTVKKPVVKTGVKK